MAPDDAVAACIELAVVECLQFLVSGMRHGHLRAPDCVFLHRAPLDVRAKPSRASTRDVAVRTHAHPVDTWDTTHHLGRYSVYRRETPQYDARVAALRRSTVTLSVAAQARRPGRRGAQRRVGQSILEHHPRRLAVDVHGARQRTQTALQAFEIRSLQVLERLDQ